MADRRLYVFACLPGEVLAVPAGELTLAEEGATLRGSRFVYGTRYIARANAFEIDPISLAFRQKKPEAGHIHVPVNELAIFGAIADAAPDYWGRQVIAARLKVASGTLPESTYLLNAGQNRTGALDIRESIDASPDGGSGLMKVQQLGRMVEAAQRLEAGDKLPAALLQALEPGSSMGGARPKAVLEHNNQMWLAKFPSQRDPFNIPRVEYATLRLAARCGLNVPALALIHLDGKKDVLLVKRFDREHAAQGYLRRHYVSALSLLGKHPGETLGTSYVDIVGAIRRHVTPAAIEASARELFGRMVFNILCTNDDDHLKNHGFLWNGESFELSPLFDVVPHPQIATERYLNLGIGDEGRLATLTNAMSKYAAFGLTVTEAAGIVERIARVTRQWKGYFEESGVSGKDIEKVTSAFRRPTDIGLDEVKKRLKRSKPTLRS